MGLHCESFRISEEEQTEAYEALQKLIEEGSDIEAITQIHDKYYLKKIIDGLIKMDSILYKRLTGKEAAFHTEQFLNKGAYTGFCQMCGKWMGESLPRRFCNKCYKEMKRKAHTD